MKLSEVQRLCRGSKPRGGVCVLESMFSIIMVFLNSDYLADHVVCYRTGNSSALYM